MSELAKKLIAKNIKTKESFLDLGNCGLKSLPRELFRCKWLKELNLSSHFIKDEWSTSQNKGLPNSFEEDNALAGLSDLTQLNQLHLRNCEVSNLKPLEVLKKLTYLDLSSNEISNIQSLQNLTHLKTLRLDENYIKEIEPLISLSQLTYLDLSQNFITDISPLQNLSSLIQLYIGENDIIDISPLSSLHDLLRLFLYSNGIQDISPISTLLHLQDLTLAENEIEDLTPLTSLIDLKELSLNSNKIKNADGLSSLINLQNLDIGGNLITNIDVIVKLTNITDLDCSDNPIEEITALKNLKKLTSLNVGKTNISNIDILNHLENLSHLYCDEVTIKEFSIISQLQRLKSLSLDKNGITNIEFITRLQKLSFLSLDNNNISNLDALKNLKQLRFLYLRHNSISDISPLEALKKLEYLYINNNRIYSLSSLESIIHFKKLELRIHNNPFLDDIDLILDENDDKQFDYIIALILRTKEPNQRNIALPVKILFLGNHGSGKSSLLHYLLNEDLPNKSDSTHIIRIIRYNYDTKNKLLPDAIIFDFGGQDYYHGIYRAFFSKGAIQVLLWNIATNENRIQDQDSNKVPIRNYNLNYWFGQKKYLEKEKFQGFQSPLLLVQTFADHDRRISYSNEKNTLRFNISNDYFLCLVKQENIGMNKSKEFELGRKYFKSCFDIIIQDNKIAKKEPIWYIQFIAYILKIRTGANSYKSVKISTLLKYYRWTIKDKMRFLRSELLQLHKKGLILYYDHPDLNEVVWLNPESLVDYVHSNILKKELIKNEKNNFDERGKVKKSVFSRYDKDIIKLLLLQKVIFLHLYEQDGIEKYIIPNYLPLAQEDPNFDLLTFGIQTPLFILKFEEYIPFGLINQMTCFYGKLPEKKKFWRDQILFTLNKNLILIQLDFDNLEIIVHGHASITEQEKKYLFYSVMALYWDTVPLEFSEFRKGKQNDEDKQHENRNDSGTEFTWEMYDRIFNNEACYPEDLYISVNNVDFICYVDLCGMDEESTKILSFQKEEKKIDKTKGREIPISQFQFFTNTILKKMKKIFISYSKFDEDYKEEFRKHLVILREQKLIDDFNCKQIDLGADWDATIQKEVDECDIMICLVSVDFLNTDYIRKYEVRKAIEKGKQLIPIIIKPCDWEESEIGKFYASLRGTNISLDKDLILKNIIKETTSVERAAHWTAIVKEFREKLFK